MAYDYSKLDGLITEKCKTRAAFAEAIGRSERSISLKMNGKVEWSQNEIAKACEVLGIKPDEISAYFFNLKVQHD